MSLNRLDVVWCVIKKTRQDWPSLAFFLIYVPFHGLLALSSQHENGMSLWTNQNDAMQRYRSVAVAALTLWRTCAIGVMALQSCEVKSWRC